METNRRNALKLGAAAAVASVIPMTASAAPDGDREGVRLFNAFSKAHHAAMKLHKVYTDAEVRAHAMTPYPPELAALGKPPFHVVWRKDLDRLFRREGLRATRGIKGGNGDVAWEAAIKPVGDRYVHRLALLDKWKADREAAIKSCGVKKADAASNRAFSVEDRALERLGKYEARTPHGVMLKLIAVEIWYGGDWMVGDSSDVALVGAAADAKRLLGRRAS